MINTSLQAYELADRSIRMNLPTSQSRGVLAAAGGTGNTSSSTKEVTSTWEPTVDRPNLPNLPQFAAPEYSDSEVAKLRQRHAGPNIRRLRDVTLAALGPQQFENPNVRRTTVRQALQGYGSGLGQILASAQGSAVSQYGQKYQTQYNEAAANYKTQSESLMREYDQLWNNYLKTGTQRTVTNANDVGVNVNSGRGVTSVPSQPRPIQAPSWSPDVKYQNFTVNNPNDPMPYFVQGTSGY